MRVLLQRVQHASVRVDGAVTGSIRQGFLLLVGITPSDTEDIMKKMAGNGEDAPDLKKRHAGILHSRCIKHSMKNCAPMVSMWKRVSSVRI